MTNRPYPFMSRENDELINFKPKCLWMLQMETTVNPVQNSWIFGTVLVVAVFFCAGLFIKFIT